MKRERAIDRLRRVHGGSWVYEGHAFGCYLQVNTGRRVYRCAALAPRFDGDDDSFQSQLRWCDTGERAEFAEIANNTENAP